MGKRTRFTDRASWLSVCAFGLGGYVNAAAQQQIASVPHLSPVSNSRTEYQSQRLRPGQNIPARPMQSATSYGSTAHGERRSVATTALYNLPANTNLSASATRTAEKSDPKQLSQPRPSFFSRSLATNYPAVERVSKSQGRAKPRLISRFMHPFGGADSAQTRDLSRTSRFTGLVLTGTASWYGSDFHGGPTANGERYDMWSMTAAHRTLPFGTIIRVTNLDNGNECIVRVNNRGPYRRNRILDLSKGAARQLGMIRSGLAKVKVEVLGQGG